MTTSGTEALVSGDSAADFHEVREVFERAVASGAELGASLTVDVDGETVVDLWGGYRDEARTVSWTEDTITNVWSLTKTVSNLAVLVLADRGLLDVHAPVAEYWPEFAAAGKADIRVAQVMGHTSGLSGWAQRPFATEDMYDRERSVALLAAQEPWWEPGTASGYHGNTQGHLLGEIVRRISGRSLREFVAEELAAPVGADFQIGCRPTDRGRVADIVPPPPLPFDVSAMDQDSPAYKSMTGPASTAEDANTEAWRDAEMGALNGHGNARGACRLLRSITLDGWSGGTRLLSPSTIELIFEEQANGVDVVLGMPLRWGTGYALPLPASVPAVPEGRICFWGGWGGSFGLMDLDRRLTFTYVMNRMGPGLIGSDRSDSYLTATLRALLSRR
ncbi:serine hydrolase domain-containing protein [Pseudonocardia pini]|uniref:serine hydrolase domain-containing protein n=1 Tax=Pseudonocardia pini TaxID=2758030 RepID=UPI0015F06150|nr:serine hydrolase domain-containing protein [Pseudonocardia pini]